MPAPTTDAAELAAAMNAHTGPSDVVYDVVLDAPATLVKFGLLLERANPVSGYDPYSVIVPLHGGLCIHRDYRGRWVVDGDPDSPEADAAWEAIWRGEEQGRSQASFTEDLAEDRRLLDGVLDGTYSPVKVVGRGYRSPKATAIRWLVGQIEKGAVAVATRGRSCVLNRGNVAHMLRNGWQPPEAQQPTPPHAPS